MATGSSAKKAPNVNGDTADKKPKKKFNNELFLGGIQGILIQENRMAEDEKRDESPAFWDALGTWGALLSAPYDEEFDNAVDAINAFEQWLSESSWEYTAPVLYNRKTFTVTLTMAAASGEISVAMTAEIPEGVNLCDSIASAKKDLQEAVVAAFPRSSANKSTPKGQGSKNSSDDTPSETESVTFSTLRVQKFQGKLVARLIPDEGSWSQFGVSLYPNIAKKFHIDVPNKAGEYDLIGTMEYELKDDGTPKRVVSVELEEEPEE